MASAPVNFLGGPLQAFMLSGADATTMGYYYKILSPWMSGAGFIHLRTRQQLKQHDGNGFWWL